MRTYPLPISWSALKFAARYQLNTHVDFYVAGDNLVVFPKLQDDPPIFDLPDPPGPLIKDRLDAVRTVADLIPILKEKL